MSWQGYDNEWLIKYERENGAVTRPNYGATQRDSCKEKAQPAKRKRAIKSSEHKEQCKVLQWSEKNEHLYPALVALHAVPNGAAKSSRIEGAKMKREGQKSGILDLHLPCPIGPYSGLWIEMKYGYNKPTKEQKEFIDIFRWLGHDVHVCYSSEEAIDVIENYLTQELRQVA